MNTFCIHITASVKMCEKRNRFRFVYAFVQQSIHNMYIAWTAMFDVVSHSPLNYVHCIWIAPAADLFKYICSVYISPRSFHFQ